MRSPTQRELSGDDVAAYARVAFGQGAAVVDCAELSGGGFAAVWRARLADGRDVVLKVGPAAAVPLLRYEAGMIESEARYFRLVERQAPVVPVPRVLHHGDGWLFATLLPGTPLTGLDGPQDGVREQLGAALAAVHGVTGDRFGYPGPRPHGTTWSAAFAAMVDALLADAEDWQVALPVPAGAIRALVASHAGVLDEVTRPALVHFDLWDGNVLAVDGRLTGIVDGERYLCGDPLVDFVSPALTRRIEDEPDHPFVRGYARAAGRPTVFTSAERRRLALYRLYLYLLMHVEVPSRAIDDQARIDFVARLLAEEARLLSA
ncbi:aminoglycoside phosphotransferase family protein [Catellatospora sp. KI3]|uniref:phosphotransferase family protein n=1 Tax=Catellatospora sp. KI3 TaxID=3041620 RepID=UPI0024831D04|nr:aminoglycoside phosphotransferase family protein [Catellatospora sp. KI3]MDI1464615.1 aminoglycoside phosphotransferase family protein [Catellatospora sp. KI3]